ncbi:hypothetical protein SAMN02745172_02452 [Pseudoxanthobacter soli DSM 19599]|uniref:DUF4376 domain-containing protein n=1 Tax=Pseudoxanthobacter soli DSM 19599 TaxID=1123029 RepID=A0A1M7ZLN0_9HYPH|nr:hypothetical protein [Pseudoxanthobacter soli]SHO65805.1 hypothetical protein SAMN02745172_02452 [Pseudoxanthobacter soli DSM 19599]
MSWALIIDDTVHEVFAEKPVLHPSLDLVEVASDVEPGWRRINGVIAPPPDPTLEERRTALIAAVGFIANRMVAEGAPYLGQRIALDEGSRADITGMATTAVAAAGGAVPWPESYSLGWITQANSRLALPTPADGLALAAAVGDYYARIRQHARTLKDVLIAATDEAALHAIDITAGWPDE